MECSLRQIASILKNAGSIVVTAHIHPDGDSLGSMLGLNQYLLSCGKSVQMVIDDDVPRRYEFLPGSKNIVQPQDITITPDLLVVLDASDIERIGAVNRISRVPILNIDHHISNTKFADYWYVNSNAAATGEIILDLLNMENVAINSEIATCLYTAIATDCGFFRYANTTAHTHGCAAQLIKCGVRPHVISEHMETKPLESLTRTLEVLKTLELFFDGKIAAVSIEHSNADSADSTEGLINYPRNIEGVEIAIMFTFADQNTARVSFRSRSVDVSALALTFGGGGHIRAAGCTVIGSKDEVKTKVIKAAAQLIGGKL
ncbi:Bifunctional oligoribonuclease and PAP phosphatase NrnA [bioreactor metagenome]|uniref:Bifunctional oligoribonuclease and PAP phosphatase NrnA n=1 Tax=bioreactor metagenome TaxID=1076179 RepID=A0A644T328_9ZZZZ|nr:bifunctional oligoribonuclease/PAP phosphatase NrnA [Negativicutes bacterium]